MRPFYRAILAAPMVGKTLGKNRMLMRAQTACLTTLE
jgi:hypothetical protein